MSSVALHGCASVSEGVTRGLMGSDKEKPPRYCEITGPAFEGLTQRLRRYELSGPSVFAEGENQHRVKVMIVHGIGTHPPGYSARFQRNLTQALGLTVRREEIKEISLRSLKFPGVPLGTLRVLHYRNEDGSREFLFYEVSWSEITAEKKASLAYDTSGEQAYKRAGINQTLKGFINDRVTDPLLYYGEDHEKILSSVATGICWMLKGDWDELPESGVHTCSGLDYADVRQIVEDEYVFVTHSLGSRIVSDSFQQEAAGFDETIERQSLAAEDREKVEAVFEALRNKDFTVYMMANQLPLLELGRIQPRELGKRHEYCGPDAPKGDERAINDLFIVAFSDPNDPLSYAIPTGFAEDHIDSRLCPRIVNVSVAVTDTINLLGLGEFAHPMKAHTEYENDARVIGLIVGGIGDEDVDATVAAECTWIRTVGDEGMNEKGG
jgi:hypothetical protein